MEELTLHVTIEDEQVVVDERSFALTGLKLQGAVSRKNRLSLTTAIMADLTVTRLRWVRVQQGQQTQSGIVTLPVYLNANRSDILFTVDLQVASADEELSFYERGVALLASTSLN